ncbi:IpaD/SipD/SspD family type III secretion system needle tip protein [Citrobacter sp. U14242]|uniref:IpaD/SipD/SspD family type III secretion system needle tip protein n=1 Tax=Citrobacter sp. U14242 TaxID=3390192 RepID=UPI003977FD42
MTTIAASFTSRTLLSSLRAATETVSTTEEVTDASVVTTPTSSDASRQQVIDTLLAKLAVYSEQYNELLKKGIQIDTLPAQNVLKSSLPTLLATGVKGNSTTWDVPLDGNMDKDGDGVIDGDIDYSTYTWKDDGVPQSDWEIYANVTTELGALKKTYMDVYTDLANQSVEYLDAVNGFKTRMVNYITSSDDKKNEDNIYIDVAGIAAELDTIICSWGKYGKDGNINTRAINPLPQEDGTAVAPPPSGPVAIRGLDLAGVDYWAVQLDMEDQLVVNKTVTAGEDGKTGTEDDVTVFNSIEISGESEQLYLVQEADGKYTLYVYPDIQPVVDAMDATLHVGSLDANYVEPKDRTGPLDITSNKQLQEMLEKDAAPSKGYSGLTRYEDGKVKADDSSTGIYVYPTKKSNFDDGTGGASHIEHVTGSDDYTDAVDKKHSHYVLTADYKLDKLSDTGSGGTDGRHAPPAGCSYYQIVGTGDQNSTIVIPNDMIEGADFDSTGKPVHYRVKETVVICDSVADISTSNLPKDLDWDGDAYFGTLEEYAEYFYPPELVINSDDVNLNEVSVSTSVFNEWENSMNTMSSTIESLSQVMSEKLNQANTIYNNLTKVLSSTIEALLETQKEFLK